MPEHKACWLLGSGFALTEFLIAPAVGTEPLTPVSSLGAILNLMACLCDGLLDVGAPVDQVVPASQVLPGSLATTPLTRLLQHYWCELERLSVKQSLRACIDRGFVRMISAETQTVLCRDTVSYGSWLRKSCLPIVLMGLPAWAYEKRSAASRMHIGQHLRWLYQVGRLFGMLDDAADYGGDMRAGCMNYFRLRNHGNAAELSVEFMRRFTARTTARAQKIIGEWDKFVKDGPRARLLRQTFLNLAWAWLPSL